MILHSTNLGLRFILELCTLAALGYWGYRTGDTTLAKIALATGTVVGAAVVWGTFVAPNASISVPGPVHVLLQIAIFGAAVAALASVHRPAVATLYGATVLANAALMLAWGQ